MLHTSIYLPTYPNCHTFNSAWIYRPRDEQDFLWLTVYGKEDWWSQNQLTNKKFALCVSLMSSTCHYQSSLVFISIHHQLKLSTEDSKWFWFNPTKLRALLKLDLGSYIWDRRGLQYETLTVLLLEAFILTWYW